ncbi:MAG: DUF1232 domain-containing protein [Gammaproteobacteria bacterium]|nr:DUF1232 domain-containing protein [Gammaproteobacteria bacterium]
MLPTLKDGNDFNEPGFWHKLSRFAATAGKDVVKNALWLYYAAQRPDTPAWAKATVYGALTYFILPIDTVPDVIPLSGYSDDIGILAVAVATIAGYIDSDVKAEAAKTLHRWFGH